MIMTFTHLLRSVCGNTTRHFLSFIHLVLVPTKLEISIGLVHFLVGSFKMFTLKQFLFLSNLFINLWSGNWVIIKIMDSILWGLALDKNKTLSRLKSMSASRWFEEQGLSRAFFFGDNQIHIFLEEALSATPRDTFFSLSVRIRHERSNQIGSLSRRIRRNVYIKSLFDLVSSFVVAVNYFWIFSHFFQRQRLPSHRPFEPSVIGS